ncbi:MAG: DUF1080 domain-containing protein [Prevotellaceae bacterium]|jgi:hypothetical protein|nr:DUF1080 domain-containing protein [Prevotellaceae bacterium]
MKKINFVLIFSFSFLLLSCGGGETIKTVAETEGELYLPGQETLFVGIDQAELVPAYTIIERPQVNLDAFPKDKDGYIILFDGSCTKGWRGYGKDELPGKWSIDEGALKFSGTGFGEAQELDGGDIIFAYKFKNFELSVDWMVSKGANSGIFYLAQEIMNQPIYISAPESQVLDNENHVDAKMGVDGNRQSTSLYDMIPAKPQNAKPFDEWNNTTITVFKGTVLHEQNGVNVLEYHLWTPQWTELLQASKFSQEAWPLAFELLNNCGGKDRNGYIGLQDHGDDVWFRNIKIKILD